MTDTVLQAGSGRLRGGGQDAVTAPGRPGFLAGAGRPRAPGQRHWVRAPSTHSPFPGSLAASRSSESIRVLEGSSAGLGLRARRIQRGIGPSGRGRSRAEAGWSRGLSRAGPVAPGGIIIVESGDSPANRAGCPARPAGYPTRSHWRRHCCGSALSSTEFTEVAGWHPGWKLDSGPGRGRPSELQSSSLHVHASLSHTQTAAGWAIPLVRLRSTPPAVSTTHTHTHTHTHTNTFME